VRSHLSWITFLIAVILVIALWGIFRTNSQSVASPTLTSTSSSQITPEPNKVLGVQTKTANCQVNGALPDKDCTPGAEIPNVTKDQICVSGYAKSTRNVSTKEKSQVYQEYGVIARTSGQYEVDHLVSLELGGSNDISNLWPEAARPAPGFHEKDKVENYLHSQVCNGSISLEQAQSEISTDWLSVFNSLPVAEKDGQSNPVEVP
jgi:hypothetical protein